MAAGLNVSEKRCGMEISFITPFYHGNRYIDKLIKMVNANAVQFHKEYPEGQVELLIVNDSPDSKVTDISKYVNLEIKVKIINNKENSGIHYSRINGLNHACGKYVIFLDQDDEISKYFLISQYNRIGTADIIVCKGSHKYPDRKVGYYKNMYQLESVKDLKKFLTIRQLIASPGQCLIKKAAIPKEWYLYIMKKNGADDFLLYVLMHAKGCVFKTNDRILYHHVITGQNASSNLKKMDESVGEMLEILEEVTYFDKKDLKKFKRSNKYKQSFRYAGKIMKVIYSLRYFDLAVFNIVFELNSILRK